MRLDELTPVGRARKMTSQVSLVIYLESLGFKYLGSGGYGQVMSHPNLKYVIKIFHRDPCYTQFIAIVQHHKSNPHFPRFIGKPIHMPEDRELVGIRMEKLHPIDLFKTSDAFDEAQRAAKVYLLNPHSRYDAYSEKIIKVFGQSMLDALNLLTSLADSKQCWGDLHTQNMMQRDDGTIVIIDPVAARPS